jgi:hypothetical protein
VIPKFNSIEIKELNCVIPKFNSMEIAKLDCNDKIYYIDNSQFTVNITPEILSELNRDTDIYKFEKSAQQKNISMRDFQVLAKDEYYNWITCFSDNSESRITYLKNPTNPKIISEAHIENDLYESEDKENLKTNLSILKKYGYNTVLVRFHEKSNIDKIRELISDIKSSGFSVYLTYVGLDSRPLWNPFIPVKELDKLISIYAPLADGWLLNWRTTSVHNKIIPIEYFNYLCNTVRKYNDKCYIYGEIYFGEIGPLRKNALMYTIPQNITGVIINNFGYYGYNHAYIINKFLQKHVTNFNHLQKIAQVIGYQPYYCSSHNMNLSVKDEYSYKTAIEKSFNGVKCGTITFLHDGIDDFLAGEYNKYDTCDNIVYDIKI